MTFEGPVNWYLSVKYDSCPITRAVSANQELQIDKKIQRWGMSDCHSLPTPFPAKADAFVTELAEPISNPDPKIVKDFQDLCGGLLYVQVHTVPEISWALSLLTKYMTKAGPIHLGTAKKILRYLQGRKKTPITWCLLLLFFLFCWCQTRKDFKHGLHLFHQQRHSQLVGNPLFNCGAKCL